MAKNIKVDQCRPLQKAIWSNEALQVVVGGIMEAAAARPRSAILEVEEAAAALLKSAKRPTD